MLYTHMVKKITSNKKEKKDSTHSNKCQMHYAKWKKKNCKRRDAVW
jgi:hypothetical protein